MNFIFGTAAFRVGSITAAVAACMVSGCGNSDSSTPPRNVLACTDFEQLVNGEWAEHVQRPARTAPPDAFTGLKQKNEQALLAALEIAARSPLANDNSDLGKLIRLFKSQAQTAPSTLVALSNEWQWVESMTQPQDVPAVMAKLLRVGARLPITLSAKHSDDPENDSQPAVLALYPVSSVLLGGAVDARRDHIARMLGLAGETTEQALLAAEAIERMEQILAALVPPSQDGVIFDMPRFKHALNIPPGVAVEVDAATEARLQQVLNEFSVQQWKGFLKWRLLKSFSGYLPENFALEEKRWNALWQPQFVSNGGVGPRLGFLAKLMPDALDRFYLEKVVGTSKLARLDVMVQELRQEMRTRIQTQDWISAVGREGALRRLDDMTILVARPEAWIDYSTLTIDTNDALGNIKRAMTLDTDRVINSAGRLPRLGDKGGLSWASGGPYYLPARNAVIADVAMMLGLPEIDFENKKAFSYGFLGPMLAHEIGHGFDSSGTQTLPPGMPRLPPMGLTPADVTYFQSMEERQIRHYAEYAMSMLGATVPPNRITNENVADLTGITVAAQLAQKKWPSVDAMAAFFRGYAYAHREANTHAEKQAVANGSESQSVSKYRVNGMLANVPAFATTFSCRAGDPMVRAEQDRITLW
ncbi:M13-type metalloendopeptidase [Chitinimonas sp. BJB300]|uniref:M13-type metalloendopeptidase n=1 Tax=Chitinimonas sp. BJB300 TaxID=1559339 RepID=UPI0013041C88|nr:M13-type metalloendopeptidase [Chitinimonas sp. BJB300]